MLSHMRELIVTLFGLHMGEQGPEKIGVFFINLLYCICGKFQILCSGRLMLFAKENPTVSLSNVA